MKPAHVLHVTLSAPAILTAEKSFRKNPVIGSQALNVRGLHRRRVAWAHALSARRRRALAHRLDETERMALDRDGIVVRHNALPPDMAHRLQMELREEPRPAWEMRQGESVNRVMPLPAKANGTAASELAGFLRRSDIRDLVGYAAGRSGHILAMLQTIAVDPRQGDPDPQAMLHADTFHPTAKLWLFLHAVGETDGPFAYVPGSHRLTPERLRWEHEQALIATSTGDIHHAAGSFRLRETDLAALGYGPARTFSVPANTLVVADTYGFHRRSTSMRPTVRTALYGILRRNPFVPWNGLDGYDLPFLRDRVMRTHLALQDRSARRGKRVVYTNVGTRRADEPAAVSSS